MSLCNYPPQSYSFCINCPRCQKKVKKIFSTGVYTMKVDAEKVTIKKEQEHSRKALKHPTPNEQNNQHKPLVGAGNGNGQSILRGCDVADLKELVKTKNLKQLEFTHTTDTRNLRMTFNEENHGEPPQRRSHEGTQEEPKKEDEQNAVGHGPCQNEPIAGTGQTHVHGCPHSECDPSETTEEVNPCDYAGLQATYNGPHHTPHYHHPLSHYHGYHHHYHYSHPPNSQPLLTPQQQPQSEPMPEPEPEPEPMPQPQSQPMPQPQPQPQTQPLPEPQLQPPPPPTSPQPRANCQDCRDIMSKCVIL